MALLCPLSHLLPAGQAQGQQWVVLTNPHVKIYSQAGGDGPRKTLLWFERLRAVFLQGGYFPEAVHPYDLPVLRVIGFRSVQDYAPFRLRSAADAYYASAGDRGYIVMPSLEPRRFAMAAHEYAHFAFHALGWKLPDWFAEGFAEYFSTIEFSSSGYELGGDLPANTQTLRRLGDMPLTELLAFTEESNARQPRQYIEQFYGQSWSLVDMLLSSPRYRNRVSDLIAALNSHASGSEAFNKVYGKSLEAVSRELDRWNGQRRTRVSVRTSFPDAPEPSTVPLSTGQSNALLADLLVVSGNLDRAAEKYAELTRRSPHDPAIHAALGNIALSRGDHDQALHEWRLAFEDGIQDADFCYRYALAEEDAGIAQPQVEAALHRAIALRPGFDDARFKLALLESNAGHYESAVDDLHSMSVPIGARAYGYWSALAYALNELDRRDEAVNAAQKALDVAKTETEQENARRIVYFAKTDSKSQFIHDSDGNLRMATTRVEHGSAHWNPFVEPTDQMHHSVGEIRDVLCIADKLTGFRIMTSVGPLVVDVPDPTHVLLENGPSEFFCGPTQKKAVVVDYAVVESSSRQKNILRGITFTAALGNSR